jgi:hypothetical protein
LTPQLKHCTSLDEYRHSGLEPESIFLSSTKNGSRLKAGMTVKLKAGMTVKLKAGMT